MDECPLHLVNQSNKKEKKMTPNDIATDISATHASGSVNWSTMATYSYCGSQYIPDDQRSWD